MMKNFRKGRTDGQREGALGTQAKWMVYMYSVVFGLYAGGTQLTHRVHVPNRWVLEI